MPSYVSPELYKKFKDEALGCSNARQRYEPGKNLRGLSDAEIAEKLGITPEEVAEIRCVAEIDSIDISRFHEADNWKEDRFGGAKGSDNAERETA